MLHNAVRERDVLKIELDSLHSELRREPSHKTSDGSAILDLKTQIAETKGKVVEKEKKVETIEERLMKLAAASTSCSVFDCSVKHFSCSSFQLTV
jgi:chromosome segregation ATPase